MIKKFRQMALTNNIITIYGAQKTANTHYITITYMYQIIVPPSNKSVQLQQKCFEKQNPKADTNQIKKSVKLKPDKINNISVS